MNLPQALPKSRANPDTRELSPKILMGLNILALLLLAIFYNGILALSVVNICNLATSILIAAFIIVFRSSGNKLWSIPIVYLIVFGVFHFGMVFSIGLNLPLSDQDNAYAGQWFYTEQNKEAILLTALGVASFSLAVSLVATVSTNTQREHNTQQDTSKSTGIAIMGFFVSLLSTGTWFLLVFGTGGVRLLFADYSTFLRVTRELPLSLIYYWISIGVALLAASEASMLRRLGIAVLCTWALIAFPLGLRGEFLFPALTGIAVASRRKPILSAKVAVLASILLLVAIGAVRDLRRYGLEYFEIATISYNPLNALVELGGSLRPVHDVVLWRATGEDFIYGASYWAPIERGLGPITSLLGYSRIPAENDDRIMNVLIQRRTGPVGFSPIAEAYRNFGPPGSFFIMLLVGFLLAQMDRWPATSFRQATIGVFLSALLINVRNDFVSVPFHIITGMLFVSVTLFVLTLLKRR